MGVGLVAAGPTRRTVPGWASCGMYLGASLRAQKYKGVLLARGPIQPPRGRGPQPAKTSESWKNRSRSARVGTSHETKPARPVDGGPAQDLDAPSFQATARTKPRQGPQPAKTSESWKNRSRSARVGTSHETKPARPVDGGPAQDLDAPSFQATARTKPRQGRQPDKTSESWKNRSRSARVGTSHETKPARPAPAAVKSS